MLPGARIALALSCHFGVVDCFVCLFGLLKLVVFYPQFHPMFYHSITVNLREVIVCRTTLHKSLKHLHMQWAGIHFCVFVLLLSCLWNDKKKTAVIGVAQIEYEIYSAEKGLFIVIINVQWFIFKTRVRGKCHVVMCLERCYKILQGRLPHGVKDTHSFLLLSYRWLYL